MAAADDRRPAPTSAAGPPQWAAFTATCAAYLAVTIGESVLAPVFPVAADDLDIELAAAGLAFGLLTGSIAVGNVAGGYVLARRGAKPAVLTALVVAGLGALVAATAVSVATFFAAQALVGLGAGLFFAPGINVVGTVGGSRRGLVMGLFGVAFSTGLMVAALLASAGAQVGWRLPFAIAAGLSAVAVVLVACTGLPARQVAPAGGYRRRLRDAIGRAAAVGSAGAMTQYGTVAFFPAFAVTAWDLSPAAAALALAVARALSLAGKMLSGHWADRLGPVAAARRVGAVLTVSGAWWTIVPGPEASLWAAVVFAAAAGTVFPIANLLAFDDFGNRGPLLGTYRSVQMAAGAVSGATIGGLSQLIGLRWSLAVSLAVPASLMLLRSGRAPVAPASPAAAVTRRSSQR